MSKFMKFWTLIFCLLFIFLIIFTDRVNAQSIYNMWLYDKVENSTIQNLEISTNNEINMTFNNVSWQQNYDYFNGTLTIINNNQRINIINGDSNIQCNSESSHHFYETSDTYYQDGTSSSTSTSSYNYYCSNFTSSNDNSYISNIENIPSIEIYLYFESNMWVQCPMDTNGNFTCPLVYNNEYKKSIQKLRIRLHKKTIVNTNIYLQLQPYAYISTDIEQETKNAIQQQTQQQHQDAQQQYNYISNTTISNENYTNTQTISDNNTNTQTKSVVMNFWLIPLNFFNSIIASFENTCTQVCVGECGSGHDNAWRFVFPCLDIKGFVGNTIYNTIDAFFAIGMIFAFVKRAKNFFINALMLTNDVASEVSVF